MRSWLPRCRMVQTDGDEPVGVGRPHSRSGDFALSISRRPSILVGMTARFITTAVDGSVGTVTLNRPDVLNALTREMLLELGDALSELSRHDDLSVVVLTGAGRAFSAGVDLKSLGRGALTGGRVGRELDDSANRVISLITSMPKVVIAKVNGYCFTGALELALACDIIVAADEAVFGDTHAKFGLRPTWGMSQRLVRIVGVTRARAISYTAEHFSGRQAAEWGLAAFAVPRVDLDATADTLARTIAGNSRESLLAFKDLYRHALEVGLADGLAYERQSDYSIGDTEERLADFR